jgi:predicted ribosomally synthesized peptide with nif11-like leader
MSQEDLQKFLEAVRQDSSLQERLKAEGADPVAIAKEAGFSVTQAELIRANASQVQNLSDEELEEAAGGRYKLRYDPAIGAYVPSSRQPSSKPQR